MQRFTAIYEDGENGWIVATCPEVPGATTQGRTQEEARENLKDAIHTMLEARREDAEKDLQGKNVTREYIESSRPLYGIPPKKMRDVATEQHG
jgi:predicted RNase H-like HicB family nuclease